MFIALTSRRTTLPATRSRRRMNAGDSSGGPAVRYFFACVFDQPSSRADVRVVRRVAEGEGRFLSRVRMLLWLGSTEARPVMRPRGRGPPSSGPSVIERATEIGR